MTSIARRRLVLSDSDSDSDRDKCRAVEQEKATMAQVASLLTSKLPPSLVESVDLNAELAALRNNNATSKNSDDEEPLFSDASDSHSHSDSEGKQLKQLKQLKQRNQSTSDSASVPFRRKDVLAALGLENKDLDLDDSEDSEDESEGDDGVADGDEDGGSKNQDDDDEAFDSDGNRIDDDGVITNSKAKAKRKVLEETQERVVSQIKVGKRGASKKALLEMRKQSERLQRATHIELPARRGNLDINSFLSLYNIKRPEEKKRTWGEPENEDSDDADDPDYNPNQAISDETSHQQPQQEVDASQLPAEASKEPIDAASTIAPATNTTTETTETSVTNQPQLLPTIKQEKQNPLPPSVTITPDSIISTTSLTSLHHSNKTLIRTYLARQQALTQLSRPNGKGRALLPSELALLQNTQPSTVNEEVEIEIVQVIDAKVLALQGKRAGMESGGGGRIGIEEKNRRLRELAKEQNRVRREVEAREYAEALEERKRRREEKRKARKASAGGEGEEEEEEGVKEFKRISKKKETEGTAVDTVPLIRPTGPVLSMSQQVNESDGEDEEEALLKPRKSRSTLVEDEAEESENDEDGQEEKDDDDDEDDGSGDEDDGSGVELDSDGFAVNQPDPIDLDDDDMAGLSTQEILSSDLPDIASPAAPSVTTSMKPTKKPPVPKKGSLAHFFDKQRNKTLAVIEAAESKMMVDDTEDDEDEKLMGLLSGRFPSQSSQKTRRIVSLSDSEDDDAMDQDVLGLLSGVFPTSKNMEEDGNDADRDDDDGGSDGDDESDSETPATSAVVTATASPSAPRNLHDMLMAQAAAPIPQTTLPKEKSKFVEEEAAESEDEFFGLGGIDGDGQEDDNAPLVCSGDEDVIEDFTDVMELHRKQVLDDDTKLVETMLNDVTNGNLRKKARRNHFGAGGGFAISDSDDEAEILRSLKRAGARSALLRKREEKGDEGLTGLERFAVNPKTAAFAKCFAGFEALEEEDEEGGGRRGMMSSSEEECSFAAVRAQLGREMAGKFGRSVGLKKRVSDLSIRSGSVGLGPKTKSSLEDLDEMMNDDDDEEEEIVVRKKRSIVPLTSRYDEDHENVDDVVIESVTKRARHVIDDDSQDLAAKIFVESSPAPSKIEFAAFDVSKLMSKKRDGSTATVKKRVDDNDVQPLKYTSRSAAGAGAGGIGAAKTALSSAFIRSKTHKSPGTLLRLKSDVLAANGGVAWNRGSAGGLDAKVLPGKAAGTGKNMGFLVGEAARRSALESVSTKSAAVSSNNGSTGTWSQQKAAKERDNAKSAKTGGLLNVLAKKNSVI